MNNQSQSNYEEELEIAGDSNIQKQFTGSDGSYMEDWESGDFVSWSNTNWAMATDRQHTPAGSNSAKCVPETTCDMYSTITMDTTTADVINVSFWLNDDDNEAVDAFWYVNISDNTWEQKTGIDAGTLGCSDDAWCYYSILLDGVTYRHPGFQVRFELQEDKNENYWIDDINVTWNEASGDCWIDVGGGLTFLPDGCSRYTETGVYDQ